MNLRCAIDFVSERGSVLEKARLQHILFQHPPTGAAIAKLTALQLHDGSFVILFKDKMVSTVSDTLWAMTWIDDLGLMDSDVGQTALRYTLANQSDDGGWDESEAIRALKPPAWLQPGHTATRTWLSAYATHVLHCSGQGRGAPARAGAEFLRSHQDACGRIEGFVRATYTALPILALHPGRRSSAYRRALEFVRAAFDPQWEGSNIAWLLRCLGDAGVPMTHPLVRKALEALSTSQRPDGSWAGEDGPQFDVSSTIDAIRAAKQYGVPH